MSLSGYISITKRPVMEVVTQVMLGIALREPKKISHDELLAEILPLAPYRVGATMAEVKSRLSRDLGYSYDYESRMFVMGRVSWNR